MPPAANPAANVVQCGLMMGPDFIRAYRGGKISHILQAYHENAKSIACPFCSTFIPIEEGAELGEIFECKVCHRHSRLDKHNENYVGVLLTEADMAAAKEA